MSYYAHTPREGTEEWHGLQGRLEGVGRLCRAFGERFGAPDICELLGRLHDIGKANPALQDCVVAWAKGLPGVRAPHTAPMPQSHIECANSHSRFPTCGFPSARRHSRIQPQAHIMGADSDPRFPRCGPLPQAGERTGVRASKVAAPTEGGSVRKDGGAGAGLVAGLRVLIGLGGGVTGQLGLRSRGTAFALPISYTWPRRPTIREMRSKNGAAGQSAVHNELSQGACGMGVEYAKS